MIKNIFPLILLFILVSPISWTSKGENSYQNNSKTLVTLSSQSSKILADFQGKDKMDTQRNESSPRALIRNELDNNRINNLKINDETSYSEIEKKALMLPQKSSRAFLMLVDEVHQLLEGEALEIDKVSQHLIVDKVIRLPSLPSIVEEWNILEWEKWGMNG
jgi:hypothetical protein